MTLTQLMVRSLGIRSASNIELQRTCKEATDNE